MDEQAQGENGKTTQEKDEFVLQSAAFLDTQLARKQRLLNRRLGLIRGLALQLGVGNIGVIALGIFLYFSSHDWTALVLIIGSLIGLSAYTSSYLLARTKGSVARAEAASYFLVFGAIAATSVAQIVIGGSSSILAGFVVIPILAGVVELPLLIGIGASLTAAGVLSLLYCLQIIFKFYTPSLLFAQIPLADLSIWLLVLATAAAGVYIFSLRLNQAAAFSDEQNERLSRLLRTLDITTKFGAGLSKELAGVTAELTATSQQQASGVSEQAAVIVQATTSLEELGDTAKRIASNSFKVGEAAIQSLRLAQEVAIQSESVDLLSSQGQAVVAGMIEAIETVGSRIRATTERLDNLTEQSKEIGNIIDVMREIATQTHLLALNAAIESAGVGEEGQRFGVIAREIKRLADRSLDATKSIQIVVTEVQKAINEVVSAAEEGTNDTLHAVDQAYNTGQVITKLGAAIKEAVYKASDILGTIDQVVVLSEEITLATQQQGSASSQIVTTMHTIQEVAHESVSAIAQTSSTVIVINKQVHRLREVLTEATNTTLTLDLPEGQTLVAL
jgi:methyl-accepting chemotaxis protein